MADSQREIVIRVGVVPQSRSQSDASSGGSYVERRDAFWLAVKAAPDTKLTSEFGFSEGSTTDTKESFVVSKLRTQLETRAKNTGIQIELVRIVDYGSMLLDIHWFGPDEWNVILGWATECLKDILGPNIVVTAKSEEKERSAAAQGLAWALASIPTSPLALFLVLLFMIGSGLLYESNRMSEALVEKRNVLIEKLGAGAGASRAVGKHYLRC